MWVRPNRDGFAARRRKVAHAARVWSDCPAREPRAPRQYPTRQVSILEVAVTSAADDVLTMEGRWQAKLQSVAMGLNKNWAGTV